MLTQIYEISTADEARSFSAIGVDYEPGDEVHETLFYFLVNVRNNDESRSPLPILKPFQSRVIFASISNLPTSLPVTISGFDLLAYSFGGPDQNTKIVAKLGL
jgi:hypothetical protein